MCAIPGTTAGISKCKNRLVGDHLLHVLFFCKADESVIAGIVLTFQTRRYGPECLVVEKSERGHLHSQESVSFG